MEKYANKTARSDLLEKNFLTRRRQFVIFFAYFIIDHCDGYFSSSFSHSLLWCDVRKSIIESDKMILLVFCFKNSIVSVLANLYFEHLHHVDISSPIEFLCFFVFCFCCGESCFCPYTHELFRIIDWIRRISVCSRCEQRNKTTKQQQQLQEKK